MEDDNITWESDSEEHEYHKWDYRHPDFFETDPEDHDKDWRTYAGSERKWFAIIRKFQSRYPSAGNENVWYNYFDNVLVNAENNFYRFVCRTIRQYKYNLDHADYVNLIHDINELKAESNYSGSKINWKDKFSFDLEYIQFTWKGKLHIATPGKVLFCINDDLLNLKKYFEDLHPEWIDTQKKASQTHLEPPYGAQRGNAGQLPQIDAESQPAQLNEPMDANNSNVNPQKGDLYFQYNVARELGIIDLIQDLYQNATGKTLDGNKLGHILHDIFRHGDIKQWSKSHSQYNTGSSNDPYKSQRQKEKIHDFLSRHNLKRLKK